MSVISLVEASQAPLAAQAFYADGDPGPIVAALAHVPEVLEVTVPFLRTVLGGSSIPLQTKEIVILRTSVLLSCRYCTQTHTVVAGVAAAEAERLGAAFGELHFAWAGAAETRRPHYYRIQGPDLLIEYDNTQHGANHVHSVWRRPSGDFGGDLLARHHAEAHDSTG